MITKSILVVIVLTWSIGCTHIERVSLQPSALPTGQMFPRHVALVLEQGFIDFKHEYHEGGDTFIYPFGDSLQNYARQVAGKSFQQVDVVPSLEKAVTLTSADLILIPRAIKSDVSIPVYGTEDEHLTFVVSWTAKDRATQNTIWLTTITSNAAESKWEVNVNHNSKPGHNMYQKLFDDLSLKTYNAFQNASEFRGRQP